jgi:Protein of unknown function (DUF2878)
LTPRAVLDIALLQIGWWACVLGAAHGRWLVGPVVVLVATALQLATRPAASRRLALGLAALIGGAFADSLQQGFGLLVFAGASGRWLCPLWIAALWWHFGVSTRPALAALRGFPGLAAALGMVAGPLAYAAGARLGAAQLHPRVWPSLLSEGLVWGMAVPLLVRFAWSKGESR